MNDIPQHHPLNRNNPRTDYEDSPAYYHNDDIPHVLALIRFIDRFFNNVIDEDEIARTRYRELYDACMDLLERDLAPYALDLAITLINLEDQFRKTAARPQPPML